MPIKVNGEIISEAAIEFELKRLVKFYSGHMSRGAIHEQMDALRKKARDQAIGAKLLMAEAMALNIPVPEGDVDESYNRMIEQAGGEEAFLALMTKQQLTSQEVRASIRIGRRVDLLVEKITQGAPDPREEEIQAHYDAHGSEYRRPAQAQAQHILVRPATTGKEDRETARSRLEEIRRKIEDGADFADMAAAHSECPSGQKTGGSLGWIIKGSLVPEFERALFALEVGKVSEIVETPLGLHLLRKTAEEPEGASPFDEAREGIRDFLRHVRRGELLSAHVAELRNKALIEEA